MVCSDLLFFGDNINNITIDLLSFHVPFEFSFLFFSSSTIPYLVLAPLTEANRRNHPEVFLVKGVLKTCSNFTGHPCRSVISIKFQKNWHGCSPVNLLHIFRTPFLRNTYEWLFCNNSFVTLMGCVSMLLLFI